MQGVNKNLVVFDEFDQEIIWNENEIVIFCLKRDKSFEIDLMINEFFIKFK